MDPREQLGPGVQVEIEERGQRRVFSTAAEARDYVLGRPLGMVLKADGLAAGKGVYVCDNLRQALEAIDQIMVRRIFGKAGDRLIIEERLDGQETSILALTDGRTIIPLESSQDHKRAFDHDEGPNTGGMGAYSPAPIVTPELMEQVEREILVPVVHALKRARRPFRGVLYAGLMLTNQGPKVLEFNVRFGDPECQAVLMRLKSDLFEALDAVVDERLDTVTLEWDPRPAVTVVMASEGYPGHYERDRVINNLEEAERMPDVKVFHAGTALRTDPQLGRDGRIVTDGGRVLDVTALGDDPGRRPGPRLRGRPRHPLRRRLVSPRHRQPRPPRGPAVTPCRTRIGIASGPTPPARPIPVERHRRDEARPLGGDGPRAFPGRARPGRGTIRDDAVVCVYAFCDTYFGCFEVEVLLGPLGTEVPWIVAAEMVELISIWPRWGCRRVDRPGRRGIGRFGHIRGDDRALFDVQFRRVECLVGVGGGGGDGCVGGGELSTVPSTFARMCPVGRVTSWVSRRSAWSLRGIPMLRASSGSTAGPTR